MLAVTVRCCEYLARRRSPVSESYDRLLATTPGLEPWRDKLERWRAAPGALRFVDLGALVKYALALARTFPERPATLLYLYWEPLDAGRFEEFRRHREELTAIAEATRGARITLVAQSLAALGDDWGRRKTPTWLADHVHRLRARYGVAIAGDSGL